MKWLNDLLRHIRARLVWKLMASYLIVIIVGVVTLALTAEFVIPTAFNRHMVGMSQMMMGQMGMGMSLREMEADLFTNFQAAVNEALVVAALAALVTAVVVSVFVSRRVVNPIRQMMQASQHIAGGHYNERVYVSSDDELGQLARSFNQMATSLEQTEAMRRDLIANVAHELRTPLTTIKGYMEGLLDGVLPPELGTYQQVYREADRLQRLVNDVQERARVESVAYQLNRQPIKIAELIQHTATRLQPQFNEKGVTLKLNLPPNLPTILADEDRISQVLLNLVGNALQYTPAGGAVIITSESHTSELHIIIRDTGLGIPAEHLPHLFTRFYRVDKSRSRVGGGSGIGLTIVKHLIEAHDGRIWAESQGAGQGSTFGFSLPVDAFQ